MKKLLISTLLFTPFALLSQTSIEESVQESIDSGESLRVMVTLHDQLNVDSLRIAWQVNPVLVDDRPRIILNQIDAISRTSQQSLLDDLESHGYPFEIIRQLNIVNAVSLYCHPEILRFLSDHAAVRSIVPDIAPFELIAPVHRVEGAPREENGSEIGLEVIGAPQMWALGYTGRGRMLYSVDTGIWPNHPAIKRQWKGHRKPLGECWLPWDRETPGDKANSHGTHTTGTVLGLDTATNDTIGVAFNAYFIATDPVVSNAADIRPLSDYIVAYEWCLNPDGDITTSDDIPDAINNSWGRQPGEDATYCDEDMTQMFQIMEMAGIANLSSAGNAGPGEQTMSVPHNISINEVNGFTVGSINGNNPDLPISDFSSRGPGQCGGDGSILIKPEVVAPGQSVRSAVGQNEYANLSGTSMACPHAVGAVLLLKEAFPFLPGQILLESLYYTAIDLGIPGEDNTYGMGVINVYDAYNYLIDQGYVPVPPNNSPYDLVITEVLSPVEGATCSAAFSPVIKVKNGGSEPIEGFHIDFGIEESGIQVVDVDETLEPGEEIVLNLPEYNTTETGFSEIMFKASPYQIITELDDINNYIFSRVTIKEQVTIPFTDTFETPFLNSGWWHILNEDQSTTWEFFATDGLQDSDQSMRVNLYDYSPRESQEDDLVGPRVEMPGSGNVYLAFDLAYKLRTGPSILHDTLQVWIADECSLDNPQLVYSKGGEELNTFDENIHDFVPESADQWRHEVIDISEFADSEIIIPIFRTINRKGNNVYIDNLAVHQEFNPLGVEDHQAFDAVIFPNPTDHVAYIQLSKQSVDVNVRVFDLMGKQMQRQVLPPGETELILSTTDFPAGIYLISMRSSSGQQVLRLVKQ